MAKRTDFCTKLKKYIDDHGGSIIGRRIWFCPNKNQHLECVINDDGTISVVGFLEQRFKTAAELIEALDNRTIVVESFKLPRRNLLRTCQFSTNLYFSSDGTSSVHYYISDPNRQLPNASSIAPPDQGPSTSGVVNQRLCTGFRLLDYVKIKAHCASIRVDGEILRSPRCTGFKKKASELCKNCIRARLIGKGRVKRFKCPGVDRSFQGTIAALEWDKGQGRERFSGLQSSPTSTRAKNCRIVKREEQSKCTPCKDKSEVLRTKKRKLESQPTPRAKRLKFSGHKYLTTPEKKDKFDQMKKETRRKSAELSKARKCLAKTAFELTRYRPENKLIRKAVLATKQSLEKKTTLLVPKCQWMTAGKPCEELSEDVSFQQAADHFKHRHITKLYEENADREPYDRRYCCQWDGCRRKARFLNLNSLVKHVFTNHIGGKEQVDALDAQINGLINQSRNPQGRRYTSATKRICARNYRSRGTWKRARYVSPTPLPSIKTLLEYRKELGPARAGIDYGVLAEFKRLTANKPEYRHGILVFDEMHIREDVQFHPSNLETFGFANDEPQKKATQILVFQYISAFTRERFALNVAWYGCTNLTAAKLNQWFWEVVHALEFNGFTVLATVCDGSGPNRSFQSQCLGHNRNRTWMKNLAAPGRQIFILSDPSHAIKKLRNSWNSKKRCLWRKGGHISWHYIKKVFEWQERRREKAMLVDRSLTKRHVSDEMKSFDKMRVQYAVDVFSHPIENVMLQDRNGEIGSLDDTAATRGFIQVGRKFWLAMNNGKPLEKAEDVERTRNDLEDVSTYFDEWKMDITRGIETDVANFKQQNPTATPKQLKERQTVLKNIGKSQFITEQCYDDISLICNGVPEFLDYIHGMTKLELGFTLRKKPPKPPSNQAKDQNQGQNQEQQEQDEQLFPFRMKSITQDRLEGDFSILRTRAGSGMNPTAYEAAYCLKTINMNRLMKL